VIGSVKHHISKTGPMAAMASWDTNKDGVITREEFKKALTKYGLSVIMGSEVDHIFDTVDDNGDGVLEFWELEAYMMDEWHRKGNDGISHDVRRQYSQVPSICCLSLLSNLHVHPRTEPSLQRTSEIATKRKHA
jgi:hypothetical protein